MLLSWQHRYNATLLTRAPLGNKLRSITPRRMKHQAAAKFRPGFVEINGPLGSRFDKVF